MKRLAFEVDGETVRGVLHEPPGVRRRPVPLVVLAHGLNSCRTEWYEFPDRLAKAGYAVLAFDHRGHGESEGERGVQSPARALADYAGAIAAATREFRVDAGRVAIVGHSLGGGLAVAAAPDLHVRALVALAPIRRLRDEMALVEFLGYNLLRLVNLVVLPFAKRGLRVPYRAHYEDLYADPSSVERARRDRFLQELVPIKNYGGLVKRLDAEKAARRVRVPALVVIAENDRLVQHASSRKVFDALAGPKRLVEIPGSGHSMAGDGQSALVAERCIEFLDEHLRGGAP